MDSSAQDFTITMASSAGPRFITSALLPRFPSRRWNVMGFISRDPHSFFHFTAAKVGTAVVAAAFDNFVAHYAAEYAAHGKPCVDTHGHALGHTRRIFLDHVDRWASCGITVHYWPLDCPELNPNRNPLSHNQTRLAAFVLKHLLSQPDKRRIGKLGRLCLQIPYFFCVTTYINLLCNFHTQTFINNYSYVRACANIQCWSIYFDFFLSIRHR